MVFLREAIRFGHCRRLCLRDSNRKGLVVDLHRPHCRRQLRQYVQDHLEGKIHDAQGREVAGPPQAPFIGRNKPHRGDRKWVQGWSPEQIAHRLRVDFPDDPSMRISHEAIYQALYIQGRGALKRELVSYLRRGRALRMPRARTQAQAWAHVSEDVMISSRPAEAQDRAVPGHWEGDLIIGLDRSAIGTLVERSTRFTMLVHLPREAGYGLTPRTKNGPPAGGIWRRHYGQCTQEDRGHIAWPTVPIIALGSWQGTVRSRAVHHRVWREGLLRRSAQSLAAWYQREHERPAAAVLPQRD